MREKANIIIRKGLRAAETLLIYLGLEERRHVFTERWKKGEQEDRGGRKET
jgi:hypothetical protein